MDSLNLNLFETVELLEAILLWLVATHQGHPVDPTSLQTVAAHDPEFEKTLISIFLRTI
jgi:hypothetical protein